MVTREDVLHIVRTHYRDSAFATHDIAHMLAVPERCVRPAIGIAVAAGDLERAGKETRSGPVHRYTASIYRWTGQAGLERVPQDPAARARALHRHQQAAPQSASSWLAVRW